MVNFVFSLWLGLFLLDETRLVLLVEAYYLSFCHGLRRLVDFLTRWVIRHHVFGILRRRILIGLTTVSILRLGLTLLIHGNSPQQWFLGLLLFLVLQRALKSVVTNLVELVVGKQVDGVQLLFQIVAVDPLVEGCLMCPGLFLHSLFFWFW